MNRNDAAHANADTYKDEVLSTHQLTKTYRRSRALRNVTISVKRGNIYGLIGKNGSGKTTLMRILAGLSRPSGGSYSLFGFQEGRDMQETRAKIGSLIESPGLYEHMTAAENLMLHRILRGDDDETSEDELLEKVGLEDAGRKKVRDFSLGMRQRLGIAVALLGEPELLILDEPVNGLDPLGVIEIRNLLRRLCEDEGYTILISSHHLAELYQTATDYIIIDDGEIKQTMSLGELERECEGYVRIRTEQMDELMGVLEGELHTSNYRMMDDGSLRLFDYVQDVDVLAEMLYDGGIIVTHFAVEGGSLESYFTSLVGSDES